MGGGGDGDGACCRRRGGVGGRAVALRSFMSSEDEDRDGEVKGDDPGDERT